MGSLKSCCEKQENTCDDNLQKNLIADAFLWILRNFSKQLFYRTSKTLLLVKILRFQFTLASINSFYDLVARVGLPKFPESDSEGIG